MVSYDDLPSDPFERRTEIDRRIEAEIAKLVVRRRNVRRASIIVGVVIALALAWFVQYRLTHRTVMPDDHIGRAITLRTEGALNAAIAELESALTLDPNRLGARRLRAELALALGDGAGARAHWLKASQDGKSAVVTLGLMQAGLLERKFSTVAEQSATELSRTRGEELELLLAGAQIGNRKIAPASEVLDKLLSRLQNYGDGLLLRARLRLATGQISAAADDLETLIGRGETLETDLLEGEIALARLDLNGARAAFTRAQTRRPDHPEVALAIARVALLAKDSRAAITSLAPLMDDTASPTAVYLQARAAFIDGNLDQARTLASEVLGKWPEHLDARYLLGEISLARSEFDEAQRHLTPLVNTSYDPEATLLLAKTFIAAAQPVKAIALLETSAGIAALDPPSISLLKATYVANGDTEKAEAIAETGSSGNLFPRRPLMRCNAIVYACAQCQYVRQCL